MDKKYKNYSVIKSEYIKDINGTLTQLVHDKTKANVVIIENDDDNKVFSVTFRTTPKNNKGMAHILEHSVLCGSEKYPVKDPFIELAKGSLNTFTNAMTFREKTLYPIASCNDKDFANGMAIYADAVFKPLIYQRPFIFKQEGWHYEVDDKDNIVINGVVYNEMKGSFSDPDSLLDEYTLRTLFPDNCYGKCSGGDPKEIPDLTYQQFLDFHKFYYHPSNSYIFLYGNCDMEERLAWLDENYLSKYEYQYVDSTIEKQQPFKKTITKQYYYNVDNKNQEKQSTYLARNIGLDIALDNLKINAFKMLNYVLLSSNGAILKKALIDNNIGSDILGGLQDGIYQPVFSIVAKNSEKDKYEQFISLINQSLQSVVQQGINKQDLKACLNKLRFANKEVDEPKGLMYNCAILDSWLFDSDPSIFLKQDEVLDQLEKLIETDYFEQLIKDYLINNTYVADVIMEPKCGLAIQESKLLADKLQQYKQSLSEEQLAQLKQEVKELKAFQECKNSQQALDTLPMLQREDLSEKQRDYTCNITNINDIETIYTNTTCNDIIYLQCSYNCKGLTLYQLQVAQLMTLLYLKVDIDNLTYNQLDTDILLNSGGAGFGIDIYTDDKQDDCSVFLSGDIRLLSNQLNYGLDIINRIVFSSKYEDIKRIRDIINQACSRYASLINYSAYSLASKRAKSHIYYASYISENIEGISFYKQLLKWQEIFNNDNKEEINKLIYDINQVKEILSHKDLVSYRFCCDSNNNKEVLEAIESFEPKYEYSNVETNKVNIDYKENKINEAFITNGTVNYCASVSKNNKPDNFGALMVLRNYLNYTYLWKKIREDGGAYGIITSFSRNGLNTLCSYRDPQIEKTYKSYESIVDKLKNLDISDTDLLKNIIGTIGGIDTPLEAKTYFNIALSKYLSHTSNEESLKNRLQILNCTKQDLINFAQYFKEFNDNKVLCTVGSRESIEQYAYLFDNIEILN